MEFSKELKEKFKKAGWSPNKKNKLKNVLKPYNYPQFIIDFLSEYGDLEVFSHSVPRNKIDFRLQIPKLDLSYAMQEDSEVGLFRELLNKNLYYLGEYNPGGWFICCDDNGYVYKIGDYCFYKGNNLFKGIENILINDKNDSLIYGQKERQWFQRSEDFLSFIPKDFEQWVIEH